MATKICRGCGVEKQLSDFPGSVQTDDGLRHICKVCCSKRVRAGRFDSKAFPKIGTVYIFQNDDDGLVKIGFTERPIKKRRTEAEREYKLRKGSVRVIATTIGDRYFEHQLHKRFDEHRVYMDWFRPTCELANIIRGDKWEVHNELLIALLF
jgi:hypothetical protein